MGTERRAAHRTDAGRVRDWGRALGMVATGALVAVLLTVTLVAPALHLEFSTVLTGSMRPAYSPGDLLITAPRDVTILAPGQIAVFTPPGESAPYAHRITGVTGDAGHLVLTTKGDANAAPDGWRAQLSGPTVPVVIATVPLAGHVLAWAQNPPVRAATAGVLGLLITGAGVRRILSPSRRRSPKRRRAHALPAR